MPRFFWGTLKKPGTAGLFAFPQLLHMQVGEMTDLFRLPVDFGCPCQPRLSR